MDVLENLENIGMNNIFLSLTSFGKAVYVSTQIGVNYEKNDFHYYFGYIFVLLFCQ